MQNQAFLNNSKLLGPCTRPSIDESNVIADYRHIGYGEGDILLDIIKEGLLAKRMGIINHH